jgi:hypothetical protein
VNTFRHSGKLGDIVYSLPAVRALGGGLMYLDYRTAYFEKPPLGKESASMMIDLLRTQPYIQQAELYEGEPVTYDFDRFRDKAVAIHAFNCIKAETDTIAGAVLGSFVKELRRQLMPQLEVDLPQLHWEAAGLPGKVDLATPWITGIPPRPLAEIIVSRTGRHPGNLDWPLLKDYATRAVFVGLESEWRQYCRDYFRIAFHQVKDLSEFAQVVAGARLYVGNQSFGMALAEAMLIPRVVQLWEASPNRMPPINGHRVLTRDIVETYINL